MPAAVQLGWPPKALIDRLAELSAEGVSKRAEVLPRPTSYCQNKVLVEMTAEIR